MTVAKVTVSEIALQQMGWTLLGTRKLSLSFGTTRNFCIY
jgi:hypothetical protein